MNNSGSGKKESRSEKMDKMLIYIRLFLGMGMWYFEIINFALDPHPHWTALTDTLNMCQGVWVFITFVCKKNVLRVLQGKSKMLYRSLSRNTSMQPAKSEMSLASRTADTDLSASLSSSAASDPK